MSSNIFDIDPGISLADATIDSCLHSYEDKQLFINIETWHAKHLEVLFTNPISFLNTGEDTITRFVEVKNAIQEIDSNNISSIHHRMFQFYGLDDQSFMEVVAERFDCKVLGNMYDSHGVKKVFLKDDENFTVINNFDSSFNLFRSRLLYSFRSADNYDLIVRVESNENAKFEFIFKGVLFLREQESQIISSFIEDKNNASFLKKIVEENYVLSPQIIEEKLFQFLDLNGKPCVEIIAKNFVCSERGRPL